MRQCPDMLVYRLGVFWEHYLDAHDRFSTLQAPLTAHPSKHAFRAATPPRLASVATTKVRCDEQTCQHMFIVVWRLNSPLRWRTAGMDSEIARQNWYESSEKCLFLHSRTEHVIKIHRAAL